MVTYTPRDSDSWSPRIPNPSEDKSWVMVSRNYPQTPRYRAEKTRFVELGVARVWSVGVASREIGFGWVWSD